MPTYVPIVEVKPAPAPASVPAPAPVSNPRASHQTVIGETLTIKGDLRAEESIVIHGVVDGSIETNQDVIVGPGGMVRASIRATNITIAGKVNGNMTATNKVDLNPSAQLQGNIRSPKLAIAETALFKGSIDMSAPDSGSHKEKK